MKSTTATLTGLSTTIYVGEGFDETLIQVGAVTGECFIEGGKVVKVLAADGVVFAGKGTTLIRPDGYDVTDLCDLVKLAKQIKDDREEREEMAAEVRAERHQWHREFAIA